MHTSRVLVGHTILFDLTVLRRAIVRTFDFPREQQGAATRPGDGDFLGGFNTGDLNFDEVFFDGVADVDVRLVGVVFGAGIAAGQVLSERLALVVAFVGVVDEGGWVVVVLSAC